MKNLNSHYTLMVYCNRVELYFCGDYLKSFETKTDAVKFSNVHALKQWFWGREFNTLKNAYIVAILWSNSLSLNNGDELEFADNNGQELSENALQFVESMLWEFLANNRELVGEYHLKIKNVDKWEQFGHDLALSQNGHGAGFFDRGYGKIGEQLQEAARKLGNVHLWAVDENSPIEIERG